MENFNLFGLNKLNLIFYIIIIICNLIFLSFIKSLSEKYKLNDLPNERKLHKDPTSFLGGVFSH